MNLRKIFQQMLRMIFAYAVVVLILMIYFAVSLWSAFKTSIQVANEAFQNAFRRRRNVPFIDSDDETSEDDLQTFPKSTSTSSDETTSESSSPSPKPKPTFSDPTMTENTTEEKEANKQTENDQISPNENFSKLEGLALQMAHLERQRMSADLPSPPLSGTIIVRSPHEFPTANKTAPKSVLKSSCSNIKSTYDRGTKKIRFQDIPIYGYGKGSSAGFTTPKTPPSGSVSLPKRKISPASYLKTGFNFQESPAKSSETKSSLEPSQTENASMINLSSEIASNQQQDNEEIESLSEEFDSTNLTALSFIKEESLEKEDTEDIRQQSETPESVKDSESFQGINLLAECATSQQSTEEFIRVNVRESISLDELNSSVLKTEEPCTSLESEDQFKVESSESTMIADQKEVSREIVAPVTNKIDVEDSDGDASLKSNGTLSSDEEGGNDVSQELRTDDDGALQPDVPTNP